jgi:hypothetical protein
MHRWAQVFQVFPGITYQNRGNIPKDHKIFQMATKIPNVHKMYQMAIKYSKLFHSKAFQNMSKWYFWFENISSGNPGWAETV